MQSAQRARAHLDALLHPRRRHADGPRRSCAQRLCGPRGEGRHPAAARARRRRRGGGSRGAGAVHLHHACFCVFSTTLLFLLLAAKRCLFSRPRGQGANFAGNESARIPSSKSRLGSEMIQLKISGCVRRGGAAGKALWRLSRCFAHLSPASARRPAAGAPKATQRRGRTARRSSVRVNARAVSPEARPSESLNFNSAPPDVRRPHDAPPQTRTVTTESSMSFTPRVGPLSSRLRADATHGRMHVCRL